MEIKIEELKKGDEVLIPSNGRFRYLKLLASPSINPKTKRWKAVRCLTRMNKKINTWTGYNGKVHTHTYKTYLLEVPIETDEKISVDISYKQIWLVRREEEI